MREVEFIHSTDPRGLMSFRVNLPLEYGTKFGVAAADGQMGCIVKAYRDWQLSGDGSIPAKTCGLTCARRWSSVGFPGVGMQTKMA